MLVELLAQLLEGRIAGGRAGGDHQVQVTFGVTGRGGEDLAHPAPQGVAHHRVAHLLRDRETQPKGP